MNTHDDQHIETRRQDAARAATLPRMPARIGRESAHCPLATSGTTPPHHTDCTTRTLSFASARTAWRWAFRVACADRGHRPAEPTEPTGAIGIKPAAMIGRGIADRSDRARNRSDRARTRSDRARARSDRARARSDRARARSDRARARSDKKRAGISDRREFASTERGIAAITPVGSVGAPPLRILLYTGPYYKAFYVPATSIGGSARLFLVI